MTDTFQVGEVAIYVRPGDDWYGREVIIDSNLYFCDCIVSNGVRTPDGNVYRITFDGHNDGINYVARPEHLRKKRIQRDIDQKVSWESCLWKPETVK